MTATLHIYPSRAHAARRMAVEAEQHSSGVSFASCWALVDFERTLIRCAIPELMLLSDLQERLLLRRVAASPAAIGGRFGGIASKSGFAQALGRSFAACWNVGLDATALRLATQQLATPNLATPHSSVTPQNGHDPERMVSLAALLEEFENRCAELRCISLGSARLRLPEALRADCALPAEMTPQSRLLFHELYPLPPARLAWIEALAERLTPPGELVLSVAHRGAGAATDSTVDAAFRGAEFLLRRFEARGERSGLSVTPIDPSEGDGVGPTLLRLLLPAVESSIAAATPPHTTVTSMASRLRVLSAADPRTEAQAIVAHIEARMVAGLPPERIAIALRRLTPHSEVICTALRERRIPVQAPSRVPATELPLCRWLLDALRALQHEPSREDWQCLLGSDYAAGLRHATAKSDKGSIAAELRGLRLRRSDIGMTPESAVGSPSDPLALEDLLPEDAASRHLIKHVRDVAAPLLVAQSIGGFCDALGGFIDACCWRQMPYDPPALADALRIDDDALALAEAEALSSDQMALAALDNARRELAGAATQFEWHEALPPSSLRRLLGDALAYQRLPRSGRRSGAVQLLSIRNLAGLDFDLVVLPRLLEGEFPAATAEDPLLPRLDRAALGRTLAKALGRTLGAGHGAGLRWSDETADDEERLAYFLALASADDELVLSAPRSDGRGKELSISPLLVQTKARLQELGFEVPNLEIPSLEIPDLPMATLHGDAPRLAGGSGAVRGPATTPPTPLAAVDSPAADPSVHEWSRDVIDHPVGAAGEQLPTPLLLSASALEDMAACPFRYFAKRVLRLSSQRDADEDADIMQRGSLIHACFEAAMRQLQSAGLFPYRAALADQAATMASIAADAVATQRLGDLRLHPALARAEHQQAVQRTAALVRQLFESDDSQGFAPIAIEQAFGPGGPWPSLQVDDPEGGPSVHIQGRIDLVERRGHLWRVVDLKHGTVAEVDKKLHPDVFATTALQLPLYAAATRAALQLHTQRDDDEDSLPPIDAIDVRYLSFKDGRPSKSLRDKLSSKAGNSAWRSHGSPAAELLDVVDATQQPTALGRRVLELATQIRAGDHRVAPSPGACRSCDFGSLCRLPIEQRQMGS